ncbi:hypothetical protein [[Actinomadura] parvosata]|uniref:hypothetical protein n=1 Tax=[Actinomadura] parvosata TaxID=1955412 RepID=UPI001E478B68|nr:hypothetical protein [Nonomuraea sp. ATCC 55076]
MAATRDLVVEVTLLPPVTPAPGSGGPSARAELAAIAESRVRAGVPGRHLPGEGV